MQRSISERKTHSENGEYRCMVITNEEGDGEEGGRRMGRKEEGGWGEGGRLEKGSKYDMKKKQ